MIPPLELKNNMKRTTHAYISLPLRNTAVSPRQVESYKRVKSAAGISLEPLHRGRVADKLNQRNVINEAGGSFVAPYLCRCARQPRGRIQGSRSTEASRPLRCTVADMDGFLQVQEESSEVEQKMWHLSSVEQMQSPGPGR